MSKIKTQKMLPPTELVYTHIKYNAVRETPKITPGESTVYPKPIQPMSQMSLLLRLATCEPVIRRIR